MNWMQLVGFVLALLWVVCTVLELGIAVWIIWGLRHPCQQCEMVYHEGPPEKLACRWCWRELPLDGPEV